MRRIVCRRFGASISLRATAAGFKNDRGITESVKAAPGMPDCDVRSRVAAQARLPAGLRRSAK